MPSLGINTLMMRLACIRTFLVLMLLPIAAIPASAQQKTLGTFSDWTAVVDGSGNKRLCYIGSAPKKAEGKYTTRGDVHFLVTNRPADNVRGEVSVSAGYVYKDGKDAEAEVDGRKFKLFTRGENAWAYDAGSDKAMVAALKAGKQLLVRGTSSRGTTTTDTYSLSGFTAALAAIDKACGGS
jgi:invasion protein IalB